MNKLANARSDEDLAKKCRIASMTVFPVVLEGVYFSTIEKDSFFEEKPISPAAILRFLQILWRLAETFRKAISSIQAQLLIGLLKARVQKKPRGGSHGVMTRSFSGR